jgi:hypothetical protein
MMSAGASVLQVCRIMLRMILATGADIPAFSILLTPTAGRRQATAPIIPLTAMLILATAMVIPATAMVIPLTAMINNYYGSTHSGDGSTSDSHGKAYS